MSVRNLYMTFQPKPCLARLERSNLFTYTTLVEVFVTMGRAFFFEKLNRFIYYSALFQTFKEREHKTRPTLRISYNFKSRE